MKKTCLQMRLASINRFLVFYWQAETAKVVYTA